MYVLPCVSVVTMGYRVTHLMYVLVINLRVPPMNLCIGVGTRFRLDSPVETLGHSLRFYVLPAPLLGVHRQVEQKASETLPLVIMYDGGAIRVLGTPSSTTGGIFVNLGVYDYFLDADDLFNDMTSDGNITCFDASCVFLSRLLYIAYVTLMLVIDLDMLYRIDLTTCLLRVVLL